MIRYTRAGTALAFLCFASWAFAQEPANVRVSIRYSIEADREGRVLQFREMTDALKQIGFVQTPKENAHLDAFDPMADRLEGTIGRSKAALILADGRIKTISLEPESAPSDKPAVCQIAATLPSGLALEQQRQLHEQVVAQLTKLGFHENIAYDHAKYTRVRGSVPGNVFALLVKDLRNLPAGWFAAAASKSDLPLPIRATNPIRIVEWLPNAPDTTATIPADLAKGKFAHDLTVILQKADGKELRVELLFDGLPPFGNREMADRISLACPSATLEGIVGQSATVRVGKVADVPGLANLPEVKTLRMARSITETAKANMSNIEATSISGLAMMHKKGLTGQNTLVTIIATEFPDREKIKGSVHYLDLTPELSLTLEPSKPNSRHPGTGTATALAVRMAAPAAEIMLVRIDPYAFHQLMTVAFAATGLYDSDAMQVRLKELIGDANTLNVRRNNVMDEYSAALRNISDDDKPTQRREAAKAAYDKLKADEATFNGRLERFQVLRNGLKKIGSSNVIVNTVVSDVGQPHDGLSALNAVIAEKFTPKPQRSAIKAASQKLLPVWVQAAGQSNNAIWAGAFADHDGNGVMEFSNENELNFIGQQKANATIRITAQWREPIDIDSGMESSQFPIVLKLLKQIDPSGAKANKDEMIEVARAAGTPVRIHKTNSAAVFEQTLDVVIPADGRFALRVEGKKIESQRPGQLPQMQISPRIVIEGATFETQQASQVGVSIPGESTSVITVGSAQSQRGAGPGITMLPKPDVIADASVAGSNLTGPAIAAGYVGGSMACLANAGIRPKNLPQSLGIAAGSMLQFSDSFLSSLYGR